jgi:hypothetical protein
MNIVGVILFALVILGILVWKLAVWLGIIK